MHCEKLLKTNYENTYKTWSIIREIVDHKNFSNKSNSPYVISIKNKIVETDSLLFLECLYKFLTNIGRNISHNLSCSEFSCYKIYNNDLCFKKLLRKMLVKLLIVSNLILLPVKMINR